MRSVYAILSVLLLTCAVSAQIPTPPPQRFTGTTPNPVPVGGTLTVKYTNESDPNGTVTVVAHDTLDPTDTREFQVELNGNGVGTASFETPIGWGGIVLTNSQSQDMTIQFEGDSLPSAGEWRTPGDQDSHRPRGEVAITAAATTRGLSLALRRGARLVTAL